MFSCPEWRKISFRPAAGCSLPKSWKRSAAFSMLQSQGQSVPSPSVSHKLACATESTNPMRQAGSSGNLLRSTLIIRCAKRIWSRRKMTAPQAFHGVVAPPVSAVLPARGLRLMAPPVPPPSCPAVLQLSCPAPTGHPVPLPSCPAVLQLSCPAPTGHPVSPR